MLRLVQIIKYLLNEGYSRMDILIEIEEITDGTSQVFVLSEPEINKITEIYYRDNALEQLIMSME
jgi:hypothetical protein